MDAITCNANTIQSAHYQAGRPALRDWHALKPEIEAFIQSGWGLYKLAKHYGMTVMGVRNVLRRLGLRTKHMKPS
jgi:hypothetical protein